MAKGLESHKRKVVVYIVTVNVGNVLHHLLCSDEFSSNEQWSPNLVDQERTSTSHEIRFELLDLDLTEDKEDTYVNDLIEPLSSKRQIPRCRLRV
jgi:hypothetical protein